jgi:hypothetical protein
VIKRAILSVLLATSSLLLLSGCGGSGGSNSVASGITYRTDWSSRGNAGQITGQSQRVTIYNDSGLAQTNLVLNNPTLATEEIIFDLPAGEYVVKADLYSSGGAAGIKTGEFQQKVKVAAGRTFLSTMVGVPITSLTVTPGDVTTNVDRSAQFVASGASSTGVGTFTAPASMVWSVLGGVGTVSSTGTFNGTTVGTGTVRATYAPTGRIGSSPVNVAPAQSATNSKWTVFVFMSAANDLAEFGTRDINEMEKVAQNSNVRFVVQWKHISSIPNAQFDGTRRYLIKPDTTSAVVSEMIQDLGTGVDMGQPETLADFIRWGKANYPSDRSAMIVWSHASGWRKQLEAPTYRGISQDDEFGTLMNVWDFDRAFGTNKFDIISCDACLMQMTEVAYQIRNNCDYFVAAQENTPADGYPYDLVFDKWRDNPDDTTANLAKTMVDGVFSLPAYNSFKLTHSVIETAKLPAVVTAATDLANALMANQSSLTTQIQTVRTSTQSYENFGNRVFRDGVDLCDQITAGISNPSVTSAAAALKTAAQNAVVYSRHNTLSPRSNGLSLDFSAGVTIANRITDYRKLKFAQDSMWDEFLTNAP